MQAEVAAQNDELDGLQHDFDAGKSEVVMNYFALGVGPQSLPERLPPGVPPCQCPRVQAAGRRVRASWIPTFVPSVGAYKYSKTTGKVTTTARPLAQRKSLYAGVVAQVALRTANEVFRADTPGNVWARSCSMGTFTRSIPAPASRFTLVS